jgi:hypothetical protein
MLSQTSANRMARLALVSAISEPLFFPQSYAQRRGEILGTVDIANDAGVADGNF